MGEGLLYDTGSSKGQRILAYYPHNLNFAKNHNVSLEFYKLLQH